MKKHESVTALLVITAFVVMATLLAGVVRAGVLEPVDPPDPTMHTLDEIYNKLDQLVPSDCGVPAPVEKTGQITSHATGDDGNLEMGMPWPIPRFTDNGDGTVTDNLTGLMWLEDANCIAAQYPSFDNDETFNDGKVTWQHALDFVAGINDGTYPDCGAGHTDWRLANIRELASLIHYDFTTGPVLPNTAGTGQWSEGDPFWGVAQNLYWTSSSIPVGGMEDAWVMHLTQPYWTFRSKNDYSYYVWPVRHGQ